MQEDGEVKKTRNDYDTRQDVTTKSIATCLTENLRPLDEDHLKVDWSELPTSISNHFLQNAKQGIRERIYADIHGPRWERWHYY